MSGIGQVNIIVAGYKENRGRQKIIVIKIFPRDVVARFYDKSGRSKREKMDVKSGDSEGSFMAGKDLFLKNGVKIWVR